MQIYDILSKLVAEKMYIQLPLSFEASYMIQGFAFHTMGRIKVSVKNLFLVAKNPGEAS